MIVVVTGGRDNDGAWLRRRLNQLLAADYVDHVECVLAGDCPTGADAVAREWCHDNDVNVVVFKAQWVRLGKAAGPHRNTMIAKWAQQLKDVSPILALSCRGGRGTADCTRKLERAGITVEREP